MVMCPFVSRHLPSRIAITTRHVLASRISSRTATTQRLYTQAAGPSIPLSQTRSMSLQSSPMSITQATRSSSAFLIQHGWHSDLAESSSVTTTILSSSSPRQRRQSFSTTARLLSSSTEPVVFHTPMLNKMRPKLESMKQLHDKVLLEINGQSAEGEDLSPSKFAEKTKQLHDLSLITDRFTEVEQQIRDLISLRQMLEDPMTKGDADLLQMTEEEIKETTERILEMEKDLLLAMLPTDTTDEANAILEIRAGTGGDEAGLFAADVLRMYERFAEKQRWKWDIISKTYDGLGSIKDAMIAITGHNVFGQLKFESGVHRVQRVPATETQGRIHTSTVTVAIMPQPTEVQVQINDADVRVDVFRASGSGGQKVNTTDSAIRLTHLATGIVVAIQDERSNQKNRAKAFTILRAKLFELEREKLAAERKNLRRQQVGSGTRSEKIRTYNFPQNRVTDHRINKTLHELESVLEGDSLPEFIQALRVEEQTDMLMAMNEEES